MADWSHGYDVSTGYTYGFTSETAPDWLDICTRISGAAPPRRGPNGSFRYLELGSGQGLGLCLLAAANPQAEFLGVDFHPEHIAHSEALAAAAGLTNIRFAEADFIDLARAWPTDYGTFDYVVLHGIFSWVPPHVRDAIVDCLQHCTRPGALVYNSFNAQPGWLTGMPFRHISRRLRETSTKPGKAVVADSIALFDKMGEANAALFRSQPHLQRWIDSLKKRDGAYLVHEYLNENSAIFWHSDVSKALARAKLSYVAPAAMAETLLPAELSAAYQEIIAEQQDMSLRQDIQDALINQTFRRDIYCRGKRGSIGHDLRNATRLYLIRTPDSGQPLEIPLAFGTRKLEEADIVEFVDALRAGPKTLAELAALPGAKSKGWRHVIRTLILLMHAKVLAPGAAGQGDESIAHRLNAEIARLAFHGAPYRFIAAPRLGTGISVTVSDLLLIDSWFALSGKKDADALTKSVLTKLARAGREFVHDGKVLVGPELEQRISIKVKTFLDDDLRRWQQLGAMP